MSRPTLMNADFDEQFCIEDNFRAGSDGRVTVWLKRVEWKELVLSVYAQSSYH